MSIKGNNKHSQLIILIIIKQIVSLYVEDFCTEDCCDPVFIYDGYSTSHPNIRELRGCRGLAGITVTGRSTAMLVVFRSDSSIVRRGFRLSWQHVL